MKNKELYKLLKKNKSNSGFTLTELLVGLFMSIFVIGALGFGLMTVLATSQSETSKVKARTENSRALDFVSDEVRRARTIETSATGSGKTFDLTTETPVLVLNIPEISSTGKIVYYLKSNSGSNWKGPLVLYRWGPPLNSDGSYGTGNISTWDEEALIDGINDTTVTSPCSTGTVTPATPKGFYACITGTNTAQLFLTGQTKTASGVNNDSQTNDSQVVARARETLANKMDDNTSVIWSIEGLGGNYKCKDGTTSPVWWHMQTDFSNSTTDPDADLNKVSWTQNPTSSTQQQPQPIEIKNNLPLTITSKPVNATGCDSSSASVPHRINFGKPKTFNGVCDSTLGEGSCPSDPNPEQATDDRTGVSKETVQFFKRNTQLQNYGTNDLGQQTLGRFLYEKGWAIIDLANNTTTGTQEQILNDRRTKFKIPSTQAEIDAYKAHIDSLSSTDLPDAQKTAEKARLKLLGEDQRIVGFEVGVHADNTKPGFDLQDNIFVVTSNVFERKFAPSCFFGTTCSPATGKPPA